MEYIYVLYIYSWSVCVCVCVFTVCVFSLAIIYIINYLFMFSIYVINKCHYQIMCKCLEIFIQLFHYK